MRIRLGPVVGHTDATSTRIWIQVAGDPAAYQLRVQGVGLFGFARTEAQLEFRTGIAVAHGLHPDRRYRYNVLFRGRVVSRSRGTFRTMPPAGSGASILFCVISCSRRWRDGAWQAFASFVERAKPHFVLMVGDQVYMDEDEPDIVRDHFGSLRPTRRKAMADKYHQNWSREPVRAVMANVPTYMMWDDHDIRDGWGSLASDSPTLAEQIPQGRGIVALSTRFFEDARDVYWHFQGCHNPMPTGDPTLPNYISVPPLPGTRRAMPYAFRCGRLLVLVLDSRGERDVFRKDFPVLGARQWVFINDVLTKVPADIDAIAVVTPTPIASMDPDGQTQNLLGDRTDDVDALKQGRVHPNSPLNDALSFLRLDLPASIANVHLSRLLGRPLNLGRYKTSSIDEARDQWSHKIARPEQEDLLRKAGAARHANTIPGAARGLIFLSGDIHVGCIFEISCISPAYKAASLTSSGISANEGEALVVGTFLDESFTVAPGIRSTLKEVVNDFNFGVVTVVPTGIGAEINPALVHEGTSYAGGIDLSILLR